MDVSAQVRVLWIAGAVLSLGIPIGGCRGETASTNEAVEAAPPKPVKTAPVEVVPPGLKMLRASGLAVIASDARVTQDQLNISKALGAESYKVVEPALRIFIFTYQSSQVAAEAIQTVVGWINRSGLVHNAEAMGDKQRILVVGTPTPAQPPEALKKQVNDLMDSFEGGY